jgi:dipeptide/tripeptide permease
MVYAASSSAAGHRSVIWRLLCIVILTVGELLFAALGPALLTALSPPDRTARWLGIWFAATALGYALAGQFGGLWGRVANTSYFLFMASLPIVGMLLLGSQLAVRRR